MQVRGLGRTTYNTLVVDAIDAEAAARCRPWIIYDDFIFPRSPLFPR
jgi:hypothetical protein